MTFTVADVADEARRIVSDLDSSAQRYDDATVLALVNRAREVAAVLKPDLFVGRVEIELVAGALQNYPDGTIRALPEMAIKDGSVLSIMDVPTMSTFKPGWRVQTAATPQQWAPADDGPSQFYVWPPATAGTIVETPLTVPPTPLTAVTDVVPTPGDAYLSALANYVVFRMEWQDDEFTNNGRALQAWAQFLGELGAPISTSPSKGV